MVCYAVIAHGGGMLTIQPGLLQLIYAVIAAMYPDTGDDAMMRCHFSA
jgi:hypothetical protein